NRRATNQCDEFAPLHWITSSARTSNDSGIVRPRALAVFTLITILINIRCRPLMELEGDRCHKFAISRSRRNPRNVRLGLMCGRLRVGKNFFSAQKMSARGGLSCITRLLNGLGEFAWRALGVAASQPHVDYQCSFDIGRTPNCPVVRRRSGSEHRRFRLALFRQLERGPALRPDLHRKLTRGQSKQRLPASFSPPKVSAQLYVAQKKKASNRSDNPP